MCGVFGIVIEPGTAGPAFDVSAIRSLVRTLYRVSESRGKEAAGIAVHVDGAHAIEAHKSAMRGRRLIASPEARGIIRSASMGIERGARVVLIGHTRMVTNGDPSENGNNQPVLGDRVAVLHNGIITNELLLRERNPDLPRRYEVDTELVVRLIERELASGGSLETASVAASTAIRGGNTIAVLDGQTGGLALGTANGSLYMIGARFDRRGSAYVFASEQPILRRAVRMLERRGALPRGAVSTIEQARSGTMVMLTEPGRPPGAATIAFELNRSTQEDGPRSPNDRIATIARTLQGRVSIDRDAIARLRRCSRCVLPETFPGIAFDDAGVCTICRAYRPPVASGVEGLRDRLPPGTKVLFPLSGGRDSCYGLHVAVQELDLDVVAFTYDWGMVTDLARRNISRMCGSLGIEHVLVSADINRKRSHVRRNVSAWLQRPELGTIPLFMAGDKQFFYHAQNLRRAHACEVVLFSHNPYERTDFKSGFAGVRDSGRHKRIYYDLEGLDKIRLLSYYVGAAMRNPAYLNRSLVDSVSGYLSYYLIPKRYLSLYDHVQWNERATDRVLLEEYGWETSLDSSTTWRVGDGTAPFYNYLYLRLAGFTENDALRSNQVRAGHLSREEALARATADNEPRLPSLAWYLDVLGLDAAAVVDRVNRISPKYSSS